MPIAEILSDIQLSPTDKLVAIALLNLGETGEICSSNKELAAMISSGETVISRSIKSLSDNGYIATKLEKNTKRVIIPLIKLLTPLSKNGRGNDEKDDRPLSKTQAPLANKQGSRLNPLIKLLTPLSKNARGVSKNARVWKVQRFVNEDFIKMCPYEMEKYNSKRQLYIYYINILFNNNIKLFKKKGCGEKTKLYNLQPDSEGILSCRVLHQSCNEYQKQNPGKYSKEMYRKFIQYWSAPNQRGVPLWYRKLKAKTGTWYLPGRLATWHANGFDSKQTSQVDSVPEKGKIQTAVETTRKAVNILREQREAKNNETWK